MQTASAPTQALAGMVRQALEQDGAPEMGR
jgi:hypothetical protein